MEIEKVISQLSLFMPSEICGSNNESTSDGLGCSHNSSITNHSSSSGSWMSVSSCDCHSSRLSYDTKSSLTFYSRCILPPILCSTARTEMQVYRKKAVEKERRRRLKQPNSIVSKVESMLSNADNCLASAEQSKNTPVQTQSGEVCAEEVQPVADGDHNESSNPSFALSNEVNQKVMQSSVKESLIPREHSKSEESVPDDQFQQDAYRHSLQKLLHKSFNVSDRLNSNVSLNNTEEMLLVDCDHGDTEGDGHRSNKAMQENLPCDSLGNMMMMSPGVERIEMHLDQTADDLVKSVLDSVMKELSRFQVKSNDASLLQQEIADAPADESPLQSSSLHCPYYSPRKGLSTSTSPCKATEHINKALYLLEKELAYQCKVDEGYDDTDSSCANLETESSLLAVELTETDVRSTANMPTINCEATPRAVVETETVASECTNQISVGENNFEEVSKSQVLEDVVSPLCLSPEDKSTTVESNRSRMRSNSFSVDTPSSFLLSSRRAHTICSEEEEEERNKNEAKRRLDMQSDSEESLLSAAITDISLKSIQINGREALPNYYRLLEEQHKKELLQLQRQHHAQLEQYRQELFSRTSDSSENSIVAYQEKKLSFHQLNPELHAKWCQFSALVKGHLTRMLLGSLPVQATMKTIRDTSRTILSMRSEDTSLSTGMLAIQDATLMNRLFSQLKAAMFEFHSYFFDTTVIEKMDIISRSRAAKMKTDVVKVISPKAPRLSAATLKSLQRKKDVRKNREDKFGSCGKQKNVLNERHRQQPREVKSKISSIWKKDVSKKSKKNILKTNSKIAAYH